MTEQNHPKNEALEFLRAQELLKKSEENYRSIFDSVNDAIFVHEKETGNVVSVNRRTCEMFGRSAGEFYNFNNEELFSGVPGYTAREAHDWLRRAAEGTPQLFEWLSRKKNGELFWLEVNLKQADIGGVTRLLAVARDITDRKRAETRAKEAETNLRMVLDNVYDAIFIHSLDGTIIDVNAKMLELYQVDREQALRGATIADFSAPENPLEKAPEIWNKVLNGHDQLFEWKAMRPHDGSVFDAEVFLHTITFQSREVILASVRDITERKKAEEQLKKISRQYQLLLTFAGEGILGLDDHGKVTFVNDAAASLLGYTRDELIGRDSHSLWHYKRPDGTHYPADECPLTAAYRERTIHSGEELFWRQDGTALPIDFKSIPLEENGNAGAVITFRDITERKQAEEALRTSETNYREIVESVNDAIFVHDIDTGSLISTNRKAEEMLGYSYQEVRNFLDSSFFTSEQGYTADVAMEKIRSAARGSPQLFEWLSRKKNGELLWVEVNLKRAVIGGKTRLLAVVRDIAERKRAEHEIIKIKEQLEDAQHIAGIGNWEWDVRTNRLAWSEEVYRIFNIKREEFKGTYDAIMKLVHPEDRTGIEQLLAEAAKQRKETTENEYRIIRPDGSERIVQTRMRLEYTSTGELVTIRGTAQDVTDARRAENALRLTQFAVDHASVSVFMVDREGRILYVNEQACRGLGYSREELLARYIPDLDPNFPRSKWPEHWDQLKKEGYMHFESMHRAKDGMLIPMEITLNYLSFKGREYNIGFTRDISDRKKTEQELARINRQKELILESAGDGIFGMDSKGNHVLTNSAGARMLGYTPGELMGRHSHSLWHHTRADGSPYPAEECLIYKTRSDGISRRVDDEVFWKKDGTSIPVEYTTTPIREGGSITGSVVSFRDITERKKTEEALRISESRFRNLFTQSSISMQIFSPVGRLLEFNKASGELWGVRQQAPLENYNILHDKQLVQMGIMPYIQKGFSGEATDMPIVRYDPSEIDPHGRARWVKAFIYPVKAGEGRVHQLVLMHVDMTDMVEAQEAVRESEARFRAFFELAAVGAVQVDPNTGRFLRVNDRFCEITGYGRDELLSRTFSDITHPDDKASDADFFTQVRNGQIGEYRAEKRYIHKKGHIIWAQLSATIIRDRDGNAVSTAGIIQDITERKRMEDEIRYMAQHDVLTGLPNRRLFGDIARVELAEADRNGKKLGILFLDLDRFKEINDRLGHEIGDQLLRETASRLSRLLRKSDTVGRIGGDEFNLILADVLRPDDVADIAKKIIKDLSKPFLIAGHELRITASAGISIYPDDGRDFDELLRLADMAMYQAKEKGRNAYQFYNPSINVTAAERMKLESMLLRSLELGEMEIRYQPQITIPERRMISAEALLRWKHPEKGLLLPGDFLSAAIDTGFIAELDEWVLETVCRQMKAWHDDKVPVCVTVNISARQFERSDLPAKISAILAKTGIRADCLTLEIAESTAMASGERAAERLQSLAAIGLHLSLDDFGAGYSSFNNLKRLPLERLKIDRSLIGDMASDWNARAVITAVTRMAHALKLKVVAEGIETEGQFAMVRGAHCDEAQGNLFSEPLPAEKLKALMAA